MSRKRPAPGAEPVGFAQPPVQPANSYGAAIGPQLSDDQFLQWGQSAQPQNSYQDGQVHGSTAQAPAYAPNMAPSNQIARRPVNHVATRANATHSSWMPESMSTTAPAANGSWEDDLDELEEKAQFAKRDAQAKRKAIPPFVLKLRSFLDDGKNGDLIRWTDDGKSFVVLDEDEFAKKLIPELFKHNNYASFVRQLNMYGFHKKVGLSDNSMRASERKAKSPSEYSNPYFREGHPDLMWLIQKPKNISSGTKGKARPKQEGEHGEEAEDVVEDTHHEGRLGPRPQLSLGESPAGGGNISQETLQSVQRELIAIRQQQAQISKMMVSLKREHEQLYGQAATFQDQHTRHENSINAILTFLATVYNRSLSNPEATPGITNMFGGNIPPNSSTGNVVDVGDYNFEQYPGMDGLNRTYKKPPLLLTDGHSRLQTMSPASARSPYPRSSRTLSQGPHAAQSPHTRQIEEVNDFVPSSGSHAYPRDTSRAADQPQQDMMSVIQSANAKHPSPSTPVADFTHVLNDLEHSRGNTPLSTSQRESVLRLINHSANGAGDNALVNAIPPSGPPNFDRNLASTKADLDALARMQAAQNHSVEKLTNLLQPLSPSGSIPGINDGQNLPPPPMDIDDFLNHNEYFTDLPSDGPGNYDFGGSATAGGNTFDWNDANAASDEELFKGVDNLLNPTTEGFAAAEPYDGGTHDHGHGRIESVASSEVTTPKQESDAEDHLPPTTLNKGKGRKLSAVQDHTVTKKRKS